MGNARISFRWILVFVFLTLLCGCGRAETGISQNEKRDVSAGNIRDSQGERWFRLYYASVACSCTMARCKAALALCDSLMESDSAFAYQTIDVYTDTLAADSVAVSEVPVLMLLDRAGRERDRQEWDITVDDIYRLLQKGGTR